MTIDAPEVSVGDRVTVYTDGSARQGIVTDTYHEDDDMVAAAVKEPSDSNNNPTEEWAEGYYQATYSIETSLQYGSDGSHSWEEGWQ